MEQAVPRELKNKSIMYLTKTNGMLSGT